MKTHEYAPRSVMNQETEQHYAFMMNAAHRLGHQAWKMIGNREVTMRLKPDGSKVTDADVALNNMFIDMVEREFPGELVWGEERMNSPKGDLEAADKQWMWLIDPIDGTSGFWRSYESRRFEDCTATTMITGFAPGETTPTLSVIHNPFYRPKQTISANPDGTFFQNKHLQQPIAVRVQAGPTSLGASSGGVDRFESNSWPGSVPNLNNMNHFMPRARRINHALFMGCVALGDADISAFPGPSHPHDVSPGALIVHNAGGAVVTMKGERYEDVDWRVGPISGCVGANNEELAQAFVERVAA